MANILQLKPGALQAVPAPVLDRESRPRVDTSGLQAGMVRLGAAAGRVEEVPMSLADTGMGAIAQALQQAGGLLQAKALKVREAEDDTQVLEAENALKLAWAEQLEYQRNNGTNPGAWKPKWDERFKGVSAKLTGNKALSSTAKSRIGQMVLRFQGDSAVDLENSHGKATFARAASAYEAKKQRLWTEGKFDEGVAVMKEAAQKGYVYEHEVAIAEANSKRLAEQAESDRRRDAQEKAMNSAVGLIQNDPASAVELLGKPDLAKRWFPDLDETDIYRLQGMAGAQMERHQAEGRDMARDLIVMGEGAEALGKVAMLHDLSPADLADMEELRRKYAKAKTAREPFDWDAAADLSAKIRGFDKDAYPTLQAAGKEYEKLMNEAELLAARGEAVGDMSLGAFKQRLYSRNPLLQDGKKAVDAGKMAVLERLFDSYVDDGAFGPKTVEKVEKGKVMKEGVAVDGEKIVTVPNPAAARAAIKAESDAKAAFLDAAAKGLVDPDDVEAVDRWLRGRLSGVRAGAKVKELLGSGGVKQGADASLFPQGMLELLDRENPQK